MQDPELGIQQSLADFKRLGYSDNWINQRLKTIEIRKDQCGSDPEAKQFAARMSCEQFRIPGEKINMERFSALGVAL